MYLDRSSQLLPLSDCQVSHCCWCLISRKCGLRTRLEHIHAIEKTLGLLKSVVGLRRAFVGHVDETRICACLSILDLFRSFLLMSPFSELSKPRTAYIVLSKLEGYSESHVDHRCRLVCFLPVKILMGLRAVEFLKQPAVPSALHKLKPTKPSCCSLPSLRCWSILFPDCFVSTSSFWCF